MHNPFVEINIANEKEKTDMKKIAVAVAVLTVVLIGFRRKIAQSNRV